MKNIKCKKSIVLPMMVLTGIMYAVPANAAIGDNVRDVYNYLHDNIRIWVLQTREAAGEARDSAKEMRNEMISTREMIAGNVRDRINEAAGDVRDAVEDNIAGRNEFLGVVNAQDTPCISGSACAEFRGQIVGLVEDLETLSNSLFIITEIGEEGKDVVDASVLIDLLNGIDGRLLMPLYKAFTQEVDIFGSAFVLKLGEVATNLDTLKEAVPGDSCEVILQDPTRSKDVIRNVRVSALGLQLVGKIFEAIGTKELSQSGGGWGFVLVEYKNNRVKKIGIKFGAAGDALGKYAGIASTKLLNCSMKQDHEDIMAALGSIDVAVPELDAAMSSRASQTSIDILGLSVAGLASSLANNSSQASVNLLQTSLTNLSFGVDQVRNDVLSRASQASVDALTVSIGDLDFASLEGDVSTRASQESVEDLGEELGRHDALALQILIESQLSGSENAISAFYLPTEFGGLLEQVRQTVADTMTQNVSAGIPLKGADRHFQDGDLALSILDYKGAFENYNKAYKKITE